MTVKCVVLVSKQERNDTSYVSKLVSDLRKAKVDAEILSRAADDEEKWRSQLLQAIASAEVIVICISPHGLRDKWLRREIFYARQSKGDANIVLLMREKCYAEIASTEETRQFSGITLDGEEYSIAFARLVRYFHQRLDDSLVRSRVVPDQGRKPLETTVQPLGIVPGGPLEDWPDQKQVGKFCGRKKQLDELERWVVSDHCQVIAILGAGGMGKSSLAVELKERLKSRYRYIFGRDLSTPPPVERFLSDCIKFLSDQRATDLPKDADSLINSLIDYLRERQCLLVLDNTETIMQMGDRAGYYREGYEGYGKFIWRLGNTPEIGCCLVITSRERPKELAQLAGSQSLVRVKELGGMTVEETQELLQEKALSGSDEHWSELVNGYGGNPLALNQAGYYIHKFYSKDISAFLHSPVFSFGEIRGDIRRVLNEQFDRLPELEKHIMYWLAIKRESVSLTELREDFVVPPFEGELLEALESLSDRFLVEMVEATAARFILQPYIREYVTERLTEHIRQEISTESITLFQSHALIRAQSKDYVREHQIRFILEPVANGLITAFGMEGVEERIRKILSRLREIGRKPGYAGGNILNLLILLKSKLSNFDFANMAIRQAYLADVNVDFHDVNFAHADLFRSVFAETFGNVLSVAFSPDGKLFAASTGTSNDIHIWQVSDYRPLVSCKGHEDWIWSVAFSPDSRLMASGGYDLTVRLWDVRTGKCIKTLPGHGGCVRSVAFRCDNRILASSSDDRTIRLWDIDSGECLKVLEGHREPVRSVAFSPDGSLLASGSNDRTVRLWNIGTWECIGTLEHADQVWSVAFSADAMLLASGSNDGIVRVWDVKSWQCIRSLQRHSDKVNSVTFSHDGHTLFSASDDKTIRLWNVSTGQCLTVLEGHNHWVWSIQFSPDGHTLLSGSEDHTVRLWNASTGVCLKILQGYSNKIYGGVAFSPRGDLLSSGHEDYKIRLWDVTKGQCVKVLEGDNQIWSVAFSPDGKLIASGGYDPSVCLWDIDSRRCIMVLRGHSLPMFSIVFSPDGLLLASSNEDKTVRIWNVKTGQSIKTLETNTAWLWGLAFNPNGRQLACSDETVMRLWDIKAGQCTKTLEGHSGGIWTASFNPDGRLLACGSEDKTISIWDVDSGERLQILRGHGSRVCAVAFSYDGRLLVSGSNDQTVRVWDVNTGQHRITLSGHTGPVTSISCHPTSQLVASGSLDETVRLWDPQTGGCLNILRIARLYEGMNITGVIGLSEAQRAALKALGAIETQLNV